jgi:hypothetical protein
MKGARCWHNTAPAPRCVGTGAATRGGIYQETPALGAGTEPAGSGPGSDSSGGGVTDGSTEGSGSAGGGSDRAGVGLGVATDGITDGAGEGWADGEPMRATAAIFGGAKVRGTLGPLRLPVHRSYSGWTCHVHVPSGTALSRHVNAVTCEQTTTGAPAPERTTE